MGGYWFEYTPIQAGAGCVGTRESLGGRRRTLARSAWAAARRELRVEGESSEEERREMEGEWGVSEFRVSSFKRGGD